MERKIIEPTTDNFKTVGAINCADIPTRGVFSKGRSMVLDKLLTCPASLYLLRKFYAMGFRLGKFFYGGSMGFLKYVHLLADENDSFAQHLVALNGGKSADGTFDRSDKQTDIHK